MRKHIALTAHSYCLHAKSSHHHQKLAPLVNSEAHHELPSHMDLVKLSWDSAIMRCRWICCLWAFAADEDFMISVLATFQTHSCVCFSFSFLLFLFSRMCANRDGTSALLHSQLFCRLHSVQSVMTPIIWEALWDCSQVHLQHKSYFLLINGDQHMKRIWLIYIHTPAGV